MSKITAYLECVIDQPGYEPWVYQKTFPIAHYGLFSQEEAQHTFILGVECLPPHQSEGQLFDYIMHLSPNVLEFNLEETARVKYAFLKIAWEDVPYPTTAGYLCQFKPTTAPITVDLLNLRWKFLLRSTDEGTYHLFLQGYDGTNSSFDAKTIEDCWDLKNTIQGLVRKNTPINNTEYTSAWNDWRTSKCGERIPVTDDMLLKKPE